MLTPVQYYDLVGIFVLHDNHTILKVKVNEHVVRQWIQAIHLASLFDCFLVFHLLKQIEMFLGKASGT